MLDEDKQWWTDDEVLARLSEDTLIARMCVILGKPVEIGTRDMLHILTHPDVIKFTQEYVEIKAQLIEKDGD